MDENLVQTVVEVTPVLPIEIVPVGPVDLCKCGAESEYGVHGTDGDLVTSEYFCHKCYHQSKRSQEA
jgi:hypothetical protein